MTNDWKGIGVSPGIGIGRVVVLPSDVVRLPPRESGDPAAERARFLAARDRFLARNEALAETLKQTVGEKESEIIAGHIMMLRDPYTCAEIEKKIAAGQSAEAAVSAVCDDVIRMFSAVEDEYTRQRAVDVKDVRDELLLLLSGREPVDPATLPPGTVLVARELTPSQAARLPRGNVVGLVTEVGARTSHAAILAHAMELPAVLGVAGITSALTGGETVVVDGTFGLVIPDPPDKIVEEYTVRREKDLSDRASLEALIGQPTRTSDGVTVALYGNVGSEEDAALVRAKGGEGIGLFRTEFLFMDRATAPDEDAQLEVYRKVLGAMRGRPVIVRTLDVGGDKQIPYLSQEREENPFLGLRGVRFCLAHRDLFEVQLRALLRAAADGPLSILLPMVDGVEEVREARRMMETITEDLDRRGLPYGRDVRLGVMIETPAAALTADLLAREVDFFSIGTNDLTGYTMAADRGNPAVAHLYSPLAPAVIRAVKKVVDAAKGAGIPVGMCGEAAADPRMIPLLLSFGLDELSVSPSALLTTRREIARHTKKEADRLASLVLSLPTEREVMEVLNG